MLKVMLTQSLNQSFSSVGQSEHFHLIYVSFFSQLAGNFSMPSSMLSFSFYSPLGTLSSDSIACAGITGLQLKNTALVVVFFCSTLCYLQPVLLDELANVIEN